MALDQRLRDAAGSSLRIAATRPHAAREWVRVELLAEAGGKPAATGADAMGLLTPSSSWKVVSFDPSSPGVALLARKSLRLVRLREVSQRDS